jgi:hypothetical protein
MPPTHDTEIFNMSDILALYYNRTSKMAQRARLVVRGVDEIAGIAAKLRGHA